MFDCSHGIRPLVIWCRTLLDGLEIAPFYLFSVFHDEAGVLRSLPEGGDPPHLASPCGSCRFLRNAIDPIDPASLNLPIALACSLGLVDYSLRLASCDWYRGGVDQHHLDHLISFFASPPAKRAPLHTSAFEPTWIDSEDLRPSALSLLELTCRQARWEMDFLLALIGVVQRLSVSSHALRSFWPKPSSLGDCQCMAFALPVKLYFVATWFWYDECMNPVSLGNVIRDLAGTLYKEGEEDDISQGGMGILGHQEFEASIAVALQLLYPDARTYRFFGVPVNPDGEKINLFGEQAHAEEIFVAHIDGRLYGLAGLLTHAEVSQAMIDTFMVGMGTEDGAPLPPGWTLLLEREPMNKAVDIYDDIVQNFVCRLPQALAAHQSMELNDITPQVKPKRSSHRL